MTLRDQLHCCERAAENAKAVTSSPRPRFLSAAIEGAPGGRRSASPRLEALYRSFPNRQPPEMQDNWQDSQNHEVGVYLEAPGQQMYKAVNRVTG